MQPIEIKLIDRDEDLGFYNNIRPICVKITDFTRSQQRRPTNTLIVDGEVESTKISTGAYRINDYTSVNATIRTITQNNKTIEQFAFKNT